MQKILTLSILSIGLFACPAHGMLKLRKAKAASTESTAVTKAQDTHPKAKRLPPTSPDDQLHRDLRKVLDINRSSTAYFVNSDNDDGSSSSSDEQAFVVAPSTHALSRSGSSDSIVTAAVTTRSSFMKSIGSSTRLTTADVYDEADSESGGYPSPVQEEHVHPYHNRHMLGLMVEWLQKLPLDQFEIQGRTLCIEEKESLVAHLKSIAIAVTTNVDSDDNDVEKLIVDLDKLVGYPFKATEVEPIHVSSEELNLRALLEAIPHDIVLWQGKEKKAATFEQQNAARDWIIKTVQAIQKRETQMNRHVLGIDLSQLPQATKVPATPPANQHIQPRSQLSEFAMHAVKGLSLIGLGFCIAQFLKK